jgi:hypothetical protein
MAKQRTHYIMGRTVRVFADPLTRRDEEGIGTVRKILQTPEQTGVAGQYYVEVTFGDEEARYGRFVSVGDVFGV